MIFAAREYPSSKNHETPFREEMSFKGLRTAEVFLFLPYSPEEPLRNFWLGYPARNATHSVAGGSRTKMPQHSLYLCELRVLLFKLFSTLVRISAD
jgi:hypothetical protein